MSFESINEEEFYTKSLCYGYFPDKLSKILSSEIFGKVILKTNYDAGSYNTGEKCEYLPAIYKHSQRDNAPRYFSIPHPLKHWELCYAMKEHWKKIQEVFNKFDKYDNTSLITVRSENKGKRLVSLDSYGKNRDESTIIVRNEVGKKYFVEVDISNFFPSIYTHSIAWAVAGRETAKNNRNAKTEWYNILDEKVRNCQSGETHGIPIGPDTSNIIGEIILSKVDNELYKNGFSYVRYIDDYKCYCVSKEEIEQFLSILAKELEKYRLKINTKKTLIQETPKLFTDEWVSQLRNYYFGSKEIRISNDTSLKRVLDYIDLSVKLFSEDPNRSTFRYAFKAIMKRLKFGGEMYYEILTRRIVNISLSYPYLSDLLEKYFEYGNTKHYSIYEDILQGWVKNIFENPATINRDDAIIYAYYYCIIFGIEEKKCEEFFQSKKDDIACVPMLVVYLYYKRISKSVDDFITIAINKLDDTSWWIFSYEVLCREYNYLKEKDKESFDKNKFYNFLRNKKITFIHKNLVKK